MLKSLLKKSLAVVTSAAIIGVYIQCMPPMKHSHAAENIKGETSDGFKYEIETDTSKAWITGYTGETDSLTDVVLPDTVEGYTVTDLSPWLFQGCHELTSVKLPSGLKSMKKRIFADTPKLKTLTIPKTMDIDGTETPYSIMDGVQGALSDSHIETLIFEDGIEAIPRGICYKAQHLKTVEIPDSVTTIGKSAFNECSVETVVLPDSVTLIEDYAFDYTPALKSITIPSSVETIGERAFEKSGLTEITLSEGLVNMGKYLFAEAENLKSVTVPNTVANAIQTFSDSYVEEVTFADSMTFIPDRICYEAKHVETVNIPRSVTEIQSYAFCGTEVLKEFTLPKQITKGGYEVFGHSGLETLHFEEGMETFPERLFYLAKNLKTIDWCSTLKEIPVEGFVECTSLEEVTIPDTITHIGRSAFSKCTALSELTLPAVECTVDSYAFAYTSSLKSVYFPATVIGEENHELFAHSGLESITFAPEVKVIPLSICDSCESLAEIKWSTAPEMIKQNAFINCTSLRDIALPDTIKEIGDHAFENTGITTLRIPDSLESLGSGAFKKSKSLTYVYMPKEIEKIGGAPFAESAIVKAEYDDSIENVQALFSDLPYLEEVNLPANAKKIAGGAFNYTSSLYSITIPKSVESAGWNMFVSSGLTEVTFENGMETIPENICADALMLQTAHIPASVKMIGSRAFGGCRNLETLDMTQESINFAHNAFGECDSLYDERVSIYSPQDTLVNRVESSRGQNGLINYTVYYKVNPRFKDIMTEGYINIYVDGSNPIVSASLPENLRKADAEVQDYIKYTFNVADEEGTLRFSTRPKEKADTVVKSVFGLKMNNGYDDNWYEKNIIVSNDPIAKVSLKAPAYASVKDGKAEFSVYGYAPAEKDVLIYVGDTEAAKVTPSKYTGRYSAQISVTAEDGSTLSVRAHSGDDQSDKCEVSCDSSAIEVDKAVLIHDNGAQNVRLDITRIFTEGITPYFTYNPKKPLGFEVTLSDNDCSYVAVSSTVNDETSYIELKFDEASGIWKGEGYFETRVPGTLNVIAVPMLKEQNVIISNEDGKYSVKSESGKTIISSELSAEDNELAQAFLKDYPMEIVVNDTKALAVKFVPDPKNVPALSNVSSTSPTPSINYVQAAPDSVVIGGKTYTPDNILTAESGTLFTKLPVLIQEPDGTHSELYVKFLTPLDSELTDEITTSISLDGPPTNPLPGMSNSVKRSSSSTVGDFLEETGNNIKEGILTVKRNVENDLKEIGAEFYSASPELVKGQATDAACSTIIEKLFEEASKGAATAVTVGFSSIKSCFDLYHKAYDVNDIIEQADFSKNPAVKKEATYIKSYAYVSWTMRTVVTAGSIAGGIAIAVVTTAVSAPLWIGLVLGAALGLVTWGLTTLLDCWDNKLRRVAYAVSKDGKLNCLVDPSGIAYEWLPSNPVEGVTAEIYYQDDSGKAVLWNAEDYDQVNPQITDAAGRFAWDVPEGMWQVRISGEGYNDAHSEWLPVLPVQTDVNIKLTSTKPAEIADAGYGSGKVIVKFTKHMLDSTITSASLILTDVGGTVIPCEIAPYKENGNDTAASMTFILTPTDSFVAETANVAVTADALSYASVPCAGGSHALRKLSDNELPQEQVDFTLGDVNEDGKVDAKDASFILGIYSILSTGGTPDITEGQAKAADVNNDGHADSKDASTILSYYSYISTGGTNDLETFLKS